MSGRQFTKLAPAVWRSRRFIGLPDEAKVGFLYLLQCTRDQRRGLRTPARLRLCRSVLDRCSIRERSPGALGGGVDRS